MVHEYFKKETPEFTILVQINPATLQGVELVIPKGAKAQKRKLQFDEEIYDDLAHDEFKEGSSLEFNLYLKGLA